MDKKGVSCCEPIDDKTAYGDDQLIDFTSGYFQRGLNQMPKQGNKAPWKNYQNYLKDIFAVRLFSIKDSNLDFYNSKELNLVWSTFKKLDKIFNYEKQTYFFNNFSNNLIKQYICRSNI